MARRACLRAPVLLVMALSIIAVTGTVPAAAWWDKGHMVIALVAQNHMDPVQVEKGNAIAKVLSHTGPYPMNPNMIQLGTWPDDIRKIPITQTAQWHYIGTPVVTDNVTLEYSPVQDANVVSQIPRLRASLESPTATAEIVTTSLPWLIHLVGDVHNPVHDAHLFSKAYPDGDDGANKEMVIIDDAGTSFLLHSYWDTMTEGPAGDNVPRPLSAADFQNIVQYAAYLEATYAGNLTQAEIMNDNFTDIAAYVYDLAVKYAYPGAADGEKLSETYKANAKYITERQVLLAGYRLANILNVSLKPLSMDTIMAGYKNIQAEVPKTDNSTVVNIYNEKGLSHGATAGIAVALFAVGVIISGVIVALLMRAYRPTKTRGRYQAMDADV